MGDDVDNGEELPLAIPLIADTGVGGLALTTEDPYTNAFLIWDNILETFKSGTDIDNLKPLVTFSDTSFDTGSIIYITDGGSLSTDNTFSYDNTTKVMNVSNVQLKKLICDSVDNQIDIVDKNGISIGSISPSLLNFSTCELRGNRILVGGDDIYDIFLSISGGDMGGPINMGNYALTSLRTPTSPMDLVTKTYVDNNFLSSSSASSIYVLKTGDSMSGPLNMGANKITSSYSPSLDNDVVNKIYVDGNFLLQSAASSTYLAKSGGIISGNITPNETGTISLGSSSNRYLTGYFNSINGLAISDTESSTLNISDGKTFNINNSLTFTGTDGTSFALPNASDTLVSLTASQILTNKTLTSPVLNTPSINVNDISLSIRDSTDTTKIARFLCSSISTETTRTYTLPNVSDTLVTLGASQTLTNKNLTSPSIYAPSIIVNTNDFIMRDNTDTTKMARFVCSSISAGTSRNYTLPDISDTLVTLTSAQVLTNKTLTSPTINVNDISLSIRDATDTTKIARFDCSGVSTSTTRVYTLPDVSDTLVTLTSSQALSNKTFTSPVINTPSIIVNADALSIRDATDTSKVVQFDCSSVSSSTTRTLTIPDISDTLVGLVSSQVLTNKTLTSPVINTPSIVVNANSLSIRDSFDTTKIARFDCAGISGSTTRVYTLPDVSDTLVSLTATQTLTNKVLTSPTINVNANVLSIRDNSDSTKVARFICSSISTSTIRSYTLPDVSDTLVTLTASQTLSNKTLTTPNIGAATATSINGMIINNTIGGTLVISDNKTLSVGSTISFSGTDDTSFIFPDTSDTIVTLSSTQSLSNKSITITDNSFILQSQSDSTSRAIFSLSDIPTSTIRSYTLPNVDDTLVSLTASQTLTNKTLVSPVLTTPSLGAATATSINGMIITSSVGGVLTISSGKTLEVSNSLTFTGTDGTSFTLPSTSDTLVGLASSQTLTNKTLTSPVLNTPSINVNTDVLFIRDNTDTTKIAKFSCSLIPTGTTRTYGLPDSNTTLVGADNTQILSNKTINVNDSSLTIANSASSTKLARFDCSSISIGALRTFTLPNVSDTLVTLGATQTLTNKSININANALSIRDPTDTTKVAQFVCSSLSTSITRSYTLPDISDTLVTLGASQTLTNKVLTSPTINVNANVLSIRDNTDTTKIARFDCSSISTSNTRSYTLPDVSDTLVTLGATQTLTNKTINVNANALSIRDSTDTTKIAQFVCSGITTGITRSYTLPNVSDTLITLTSTATLTNKTLTSPVLNTPTINVNANVLSIRDNTDTSKVARFVCSGISTSTTRSYTLPNVSDTLVTLGASQTLTNKSININANALSILDATDTSKIAQFDCSSVSTSTTRVYTLPDISDTLVTLTASQTLTNKTWNGSVISEIYGGTNQSSYTLGDILYSSASDTLSKLSGNTTTAKQYLSQTGNGSVSAAPSWASIAQADITGLTSTDDVTFNSLTLNSTGTSFTSYNGTFNNVLRANQIGNRTSINNCQITLSDQGFRASRTIDDSNAAFVITQSHASSTGDILTLANSAGNTTSFTRDGHIYPSATNTYDLGSASLLFGNVYTENVRGTNYQIGGSLSGSNLFMAQSSCYTTSSYAFSQSSAGQTIVNSKNGQTISFRINNSEKCNFNLASFRPADTISINLGASSNPWINVYGQNAYTQTSDQTLKTDVTSLNDSDMHNFLLNLNPVSYKWTTDDDGQVKYGYLAQEVEAMRIASGMPDNALVEISEDGIYHLRYTEIIPMLNCSIKLLDEGLHTTLTPKDDNTYDLGSASGNKYRDIYCYNLHQASDGRLKRNVRDLDSSSVTKLINGLRPKSYSFINDKSNKTKLGLIAQDVEQMLIQNNLQDLVSSIVSHDDKYTIDYISLISPLIKYVQKLNSRVKKLESNNRKSNKKYQRMYRRVAL